MLEVKGDRMVYWGQKVSCFVFSFIFLCAYLFLHMHSYEIFGSEYVRVGLQPVHVWDMHPSVIMEASLGVNGMRSEQRFTYGLNDMIYVRVDDEESLCGILFHSDAACTVAKIYDGKVIGKVFGKPEYQIRKNCRDNYRIGDDRILYVPNYMKQSADTVEGVVAIRDVLVEGKLWPCCLNFHWDPIRGKVVLYKWIPVDLVAWVVFIITVIFVRRKMRRG